MYEVTEKTLIEIETSLTELKNEFNNQLAAMSEDKQNFHSAMIDLTAKYPEHKELVQFIVLVNDKLETKQENYSELVSSSFNELIIVKKNLIKAIQYKNSQDNSNNKKGPGFFKSLVAGGKVFSDIKMMLLAIAGILFALLIFTKPGILMGILKAIASMIL